MELIILSLFIADLTITHTFPCRNSRFDRDKASDCELEIQKEMIKKNLILVGWYHSHPNFESQPTLRDIDSQLDHQIRMRGMSEATYTPCVGFICCKFHVLFKNFTLKLLKKFHIAAPYHDYDSKSLESNILSFWVTPPLENRPFEYGRPMLMSYTVNQNDKLEEDLKTDMKSVYEYYRKFKNEVINFNQNFRGDTKYIDKLRVTMFPKFPRDQCDGTFWNWIRELLGLEREENVEMPIRVAEKISTSSINSHLSTGTKENNDDENHMNCNNSIKDDTKSETSDDANLKLSNSILSLQAQLSKPSGLNMTPSPLSSALVTLPATTTATLTSTTASSPRDSPITIPSTSASPAKFEVPVRASPSPAKSDASSSRTRASPAQSPAKFSKSHLDSPHSSRSSPKVSNNSANNNQKYDLNYLAALAGTGGSNGNATMNDLYAATLASLGSNMPSSLSDYANLFSHKNSDFGLSALSSLASAAAATESGSGQSNKMHSSSAGNLPSSSLQSTMPPIPNMKEFMAQLEKGDLSLLMQSQYNLPGLGITPSSLSSSSSTPPQKDTSSSSRTSSKQHTSKNSKQSSSSRPSSSHVIEYDNYKSDSSKIADLMKSPDYTQMLLQQAHALSGLGSEISITKKSSNSSSSSKKQQQQQQLQQQHQQMIAAAAAAAAAAATSSHYPTPAELNQLLEVSQRIPELNSLLQSGNPEDINALIQAQMFSKSAFDYSALFGGGGGMGVGGGSTGGGGGNQKNHSSSSSSAAAAAAASQYMNDLSNYFGGNFIGTSLTPTSTTTSATNSHSNNHSSSHHNSNNNNSNSSNNNSNSSSKKESNRKHKNVVESENPADMLNSLFTSAAAKSGDINSYLYGHGSGGGSGYFSGSSGSNSAISAKQQQQQLQDYSALFSQSLSSSYQQQLQDKYGIPDPLAKTTLAANNMYLAPSASLLKLQQEAINSMMMKPPKSSSSSTSSSSKIETPPPISASPTGGSSSQHKLSSMSNRGGSPIVPITQSIPSSTTSTSTSSSTISNQKYNFSAADLAVSSVPVASSSPINFAPADLSTSSRSKSSSSASDAMPTDLSSNHSKYDQHHLSALSSVPAPPPPFKKRMEFSIADLVASPQPPPSKVPKMSSDSEYD